MRWPGDLRAGDQLSLCIGTGHAGSHYGRQWAGSKNGILFKTAVSLEETGKAQIVVLDKTGLITEGAPKVTDLVCPRGGRKPPGSAGLCAGRKE